MYNRGTFMSFDWRDYLILSEELAKRSEESCLRTSISRAYFAAWCIARNKKGYKNYKPKGGKNIHWIIINAYKNAKDKALRKVGWNLDELRKTRNDADYNEDKRVNKELAERMLILAKGISDNLKSV